MPHKLHESLTPCLFKNGASRGKYLCLEWETLYFASQKVTIGQVIAWHVLVSVRGYYEHFRFSDNPVLLAGVHYRPCDMFVPSALE